MSAGACKAAICGSAAAAKIITVGRLVESGHIKDKKMIESVVKCLDSVNAELNGLIELIATEGEDDG